MRKFIVDIEINGKSEYVGTIMGNDSNDATFSYAEEYLNSSASRAISLSLPLEKVNFDVEESKNFFEGLLPEGFMRRSVAEWLRADESDYLTILAGLGSECLGAIKITEADVEPYAEYKKLTDNDLKALAKEGTIESVQLVTKAHLSLTGASGKVGLYHDENTNTWYLPIGEAPSTHIVKQSHIRLKRIVANEQLCLLAAKNLGIEIPESFIINLGNADDDNILFATKRYDRKFDENNKMLDGLKVPYQLHQEDFAQALGIPASKKYEKDNANYLKSMFDVLKKYSANPLADQLKLWDICVFNYLVGNTDNHIKNFSLIYDESLRYVRLAPAYDILSTMIYESSIEDMAFSIGGIYNINQINRDAFEKQAQIVGIGKQMAMKRFDEFVRKFPDALNDAKTELLKKNFDGIKKISKKILKNGGIKNYIK